MKGYSPSTELLNLYDTTREKPFEFMHSRSFVNINVATGWTVSKGGQFPYENVITLPVDEGDFPITMEYQPTAIIQPNANESCAPSNFPYIETTGRNRVTLYAYSIPSPTSMLPIVINLTQNGSPYGSTNAAAQRSTVEQTAIQLSQNYFLVEVRDEVLTKNTTITFDVTAYKGGERVLIGPPADQPEYAITNQDGDPILNPDGTYVSVVVKAVTDEGDELEGDESEDKSFKVKVTIELLEGTSIKNGAAIIQFPVQAGSVFYPRATINAITSTAILEQVDSYDLSFGTLTRSSSGDLFVDGKVLSANNEWIIKATKRTLNGVVSTLSGGQIIFTDIENNESDTKNLSNGKLTLGEELKTNPVFQGSEIRIDLEVGGKVVASKFINIMVTLFSTLIQSSAEFVVPRSKNISFSSYTLLTNGMILPKNGTLTIYKNSVSPANELISEDNVNEINYSLAEPGRLESVGSFIVTFTETFGGAVTQQRVIPVLVGGIADPDVLSLVASPMVLTVDVDKNYELKSNPVSILKVYRNGIDVTGDFKFAAVSDGGANFGFELDGNQLTVTKFAAGAERIVGVIVTATNRDNDNMQTTGSLQAIRQIEEETISYYTYIRYTADLEEETEITESIVEDTKYMGLVVTTSPTAPSNKTEYKWTPVGEDGLGVESTNVDYALYNNGTEWPDEESDLWGDFPKSLEGGLYLWTRTKITYTDKTFTYAYSVSYIALDGVNGQTLYTWIKYSDNADGTDLYDMPKASTLYIGIATNQETDTAPTEPGAYVWSKFKGDKGENAKLITLSTNTQVFKVSKEEVVTPATATIMAELQGITETVDWTYSIDGKTFSSDLPDGVSEKETGNTVEVMGSAMTANTLTVKASVGNLSDTITIAKLIDGIDGSDGEDAYTILLSNESHTFPGDESKAIAGSTIIDVIAYKGATRVKASIGNIEDMPEGLEIDIDDDDQITTQIEVTVSSDLTGPNGTLTIPIIVEGKTFTRTFSYSISLKGEPGKPGEDGADAELLYLSASAEAMTFNSDNTPNPATQIITFTANTQNTRGAVSFTAIAYNGATALSNTITLGGSGDTRTLTQADFPAPATRIEIKAVLGDLSDTVSVVKLKNGATGGAGADGKNAIVGYLTNENVTFPANSLGVVTLENLAMANGVFKVFDGLTEKTGSDVTYSVVTETGATGAIITGAVTTAGAYSVSTITADNASITFEAVYDNVTIHKVLTLSKSKEGVSGEDGYTPIKGTDYFDGAAGINARAVSLTTPTQAFTYTAAGISPSPSGQVTITATAYNTTGTVYYEFLKDGSLVQNTISNTYSYTPQTSFANMPDLITVKIREGSDSGTVLATDTLTMIGVKPGRDGIDGINGSRTAILEMYQWKATVPTSFPNGTSTYSWASGTFSAPATANGWTLLPATGVAGQTLWTCRTVFSDSLTTANSTVDWNANTAYPVGAYGANGSNGTRTALIELYKWSATAPATYPSGSSTYTWSNGTFTNPTTLNGWSQTISAPVLGQTLYGISQTYSDTNTSATSTITWASTTPYPIGYSGVDGLSALSIILSNSAHAIPTDSAGNNPTFTGSGTNIYVYEGSTALAYDGVGTSNGTWKVTSATGTNITVGSVSDSGTFATYSQITGISADTGYITFIVQGKRANGTSFTGLAAIQSFNKSKAGVDGQDGQRGPAGPTLIIEAPDGLAFNTGKSKEIRLNVKLMDEDINRIGEYETEEIRWERSSSDSMGDVLFASTAQGPSIYIDPEFLNVPATYTCFVSKIIRGSDLTTNEGELQGRTRTSELLEVISVNTYSPVVYTAHVTTSLKISEEIKNIEKTIENIKRNSVTTSDFERTQNRIFGSVSELITTTADLRTREEGMKDKLEGVVLKYEELNSELDMTSRRIRGEVKALSNTGDERYAYLQIESDSIKTKVGSIEGDLEKQIKDYTEFVQTEKEFKLTVQSGSGTNILKNSVGYKYDTDIVTGINDFAFWYSSGIKDFRIEPAESTWVLQGTSKHGFEIKGEGALVQPVTLLPNEDYCLVFRLKTDSNYGGWLEYGVDHGSYSGNGFALDSSYIESGSIGANYSGVVTLNFNSGDDTSNLAIKLYGKYCELTDIGLYEGHNITGWQQAAGENYTLDVQIDKDGIKVYSSDSKSYTVISPEEFSGYYDDDKIFTLNKDLTEVQGLVVQKQGLYLPPIKFIQKLDGAPQIDIVWTGVKE